jgi:hypothetical protein
MMLSTIATLASFYIFLTAVKFAGAQVTTIGQIVQLKYIFSTLTLKLLD